MAYMAIDWPREIHSACVRCVGNQASVAASVKESSSFPLGTMIVCLVRNCASRVSILWRAEHVRAKSNIADGPSRVCTAHAGAPFGQRNGATPIALRESFESRVDFHREATAARRKRKDILNCVMSFQSSGTELLLCLAICRNAILLVISNHG